MEKKFAYILGLVHQLTDSFDSPQGFATVVINLLVFCYGGTIGSNNVMIPRLMEGEKGDYFDLKISDDEVSWIASSCLVGTYLIVFVSNPLATRIGKRKVMLMDSVVMIVGTLVNVLSKNIILMCIGRLLMGNHRNIWTCAKKRKFSYPVTYGFIASQLLEGTNIKSAEPICP